MYISHARHASLWCFCAFFLLLFTFLNEMDLSQWKCKRFIVFRFVMGHSLESFECVFFLPLLFLLFHTVLIWKRKHTVCWTLFDTNFHWEILAIHRHTFSCGCPDRVLYFLFIFRLQYIKCFSVFVLFERRLQTISTNTWIKLHRMYAMLE